MYKNIWILISYKRSNLYIKIYINLYKFLRYIFFDVVELNNLTIQII